MRELMLTERILVLERSITDVTLQIDGGQVHAHVTLELCAVRERAAAVLTRQRMRLLLRRCRWRRRVLLLLLLLVVYDLNVLL